MLGGTYCDVQCSEIKADHIPDPSVVFTFRFGQVMNKVAETILNNRVAVVLSVRCDAGLIMGKKNRSVLRGRKPLRRVEQAN